MTNPEPRSRLDIEEERVDNEIKQLQQELLQLKIDLRNLQVANIITRERKLVDDQYLENHNPITNSTSSP